MCPYVRYRKRESTRVVFKQTGWHAVLGERGEWKRRLGRGSVSGRAGGERRPRRPATTALGGRGAPPPASPQPRTGARGAGALQRSTQRSASIYSSQFSRALHSESSHPPSGYTVLRGLRSCGAGAVGRSAVVWQHLKCVTGSPRATASAQTRRARSRRLAQRRRLHGASTRRSRSVRCSIGPVRGVPRAPARLEVANRHLGRGARRER